MINKGHPEDSPFISRLVKRGQLCSDDVKAGHSRKNGVVEDSRQSEVDMADHVAEVIAGLKPQRVAGLVCVDDNLETKCIRLYI